MNAEGCLPLVVFSVIINTTFEQLMIVFDTEFVEYFNRKIRIFLEAEIFYDDSGDILDSMLPGIFPKHLVREQNDKCKSILYITTRMIG